jgi:hypothetical protein
VANIGRSKLRTRPLDSPISEPSLSRRLFVHEAVLLQTEQLLPTYRDPDSSHEGIIFWGGLEYHDRVFVLSAVAPMADHGPGHVRCDERAVLDTSRTFRRSGLGVVAQVHSHPGDYAVHSLGDDKMILMPFEGMLSIVVPWYGRFGMRPLTMCGIHEFQHGKWILCTSNSSAITIIPVARDLR